MGDVMTKHMPINVNSAPVAAMAESEFLPPKAPLLMPVQVLEPKGSLLRSVATPIFACAGFIRHGFRRFG